MTPTEVGGLHAGDYLMPMRDAVAAKRAEGPVTNEYLDTLTKDVERSGGIHTPAMVAHSHFSGGAPLLVNGHHRATIAIETNRLMPVQHYDDAQDAYRDIERTEDQPYESEIRDFTSRRTA